MLDEMDSSTLEEVPEAGPDTAIADVPVDGSADFVLETDYQIQEAASELQTIDSLDVDTWQTLDAQERLDTLQDIEDCMSEIQGRPALEVNATELDPYSCGGYDGQNIVVNAAHLESDMPVEEFVDTIVHEGRHAYQDYAVQHPGLVGDAELVGEWADNRENYLTAEEYGYELYVAQPLEADAWAYAGAIVSAFTSR